MKVSEEVSFADFAGEQRRNPIRRDETLQVSTR
jgi:hypothetical protein